MDPLKIRILPFRKPFRLLLIFSLVLALSACAAGQSSSSSSSSASSSSSFKRIGAASETRLQGSGSLGSYTTLCRVSAELLCDKAYEMEVGEDCGCLDEGILKSGEAAPE
ncbi:MAG: hypothetical protein G3M78_04295 [Candidatus Nitrohelix vancouverensis]|uniref:Lipoprotein n=1 Tax=Candidatus Nitrohelix vancouverensis TaxID=2705534 RepID=A0A7T0G2W6_9BACT|nr:MAG: hypothetical protein G3M78_04295 [Candidatus Nitrohelix vancouverensis]